MDRDRLLAQLKALGEVGRLEVAIALAGGERGVAELLEALGVTQPNLSRQIKILREAGVVVERREGRHVFYRLGGNELTAMLVGLAARSAPAEASERRAVGAGSTGAPRPSAAADNIHKSAYLPPGDPEEPPADDDEAPRRGDIEEWLL